MICMKRFILYLLLIIGFNNGAYAGDKKEGPKKLVNNNCQESPGNGARDLTGCKYKDIALGKIYANYKSKQNKRKGTFEHTVDQFLLEAGDRNSKHVYCNTDVDGLKNMFYRVQCQVVDKNYCDKIKELKDNISSCVKDKIISKFTDVQTSQDELEKWFKKKDNSGTSEGYKVISNVISEISFGTTKVDFNKGPLMFKNEQGLYAVKGDLEITNTKKTIDKIINFEDSLYKDLEGEEELCEAVGMDVSTVKSVMQIQKDAVNTK